MLSCAERDLGFMLEAITAADGGRYSASPNPAVGCVIVKHGEIIARGFHRRAGEAHAEIAALQAAAADANGATAYVTLEPCNHQGRTGPCSAALIEAGITRVVYAVADPNLAVGGGGASHLAAAGIEVVCGVGELEAERLHCGFLTRARRQRPYVRFKLAIRLDGGAALADGQSQWIAGPKSRAEVQRLRAQSSAVVTGIVTLIDYFPILNVRVSFI